MKTLKITFLALFVFAAQAIMAQDQGVLTFEKTEHDFGNVKEEGGPVTIDFKFKNTGKAPLVVSGVQASCGCTTPDWTKEPVAPGKTGFIRAQYNPQGRPGIFNKTLTVTSNTTPATSLITIKGNVIPTPAPAAAPAPAPAK